MAKQKRIRLRVQPFTVSDEVAVASLSDPSVMLEACIDFARILSAECGKAAPLEIRKQLSDEHVAALLLCAAAHLSPHQKCGDFEDQAHGIFHMIRKMLGVRESSDLAYRKMEGSA